VEVPIVDGKAEDRLEFMQRFMPVVPMMDSLLFHFAVYRTEERCYLALKSHLIFLDGTSISLIIAELNRALTGKPMLPEDYTIQQVGMYEEQKMRDGTHDAAKKYHAELFKEMEDLPPLLGDLEGKLTPGVSENLRYEPGTLTTQRVKHSAGRTRSQKAAFSWEPWR
jgi:Condensation domain.